MIRNVFRSWLKQKFWNPIVNHMGVLGYFNERVYFPRNSLAFEYTFKNGVYEQDNLRFIIDLIREGTHYIDIGANVGLMSIPILKKFERVQVISVEANELTFNYLKKTFEQCSARDRWQLINAAVSDSAGQEVELFVSSANNSAFASIRDTNRVSFSNVTKVRTVSIDDIWSKGNRFDVSFVKIDIEGADLLALKGGASCIRNCRPSILIEWNQLNIKPFGFNNDDLIAWLKDFGYSCYAIPSLNRIETSNELRLNCLSTENLLLLPVTN